MAFHSKINRKMNVLVYYEKHFPCNLRAISGYVSWCASSLSTAWDQCKKSLSLVGRTNGLRTVRISGALVVTIVPVGTIAASPAETYEQISVPGKTIFAYRPLAQRKRVVGKCHPEASKAIACEQQAAIARKEALGAKQAASLRNAGRIHEESGELLQ